MTLRKTNLARITNGMSMTISWNKLSLRCGEGLEKLIETGKKLKLYFLMRSHASALKAKINSELCKMKKRSF